MEEKPRSSSTMLLVILAAGAIYLGVTQYFGIGQGEESEEGQTSEQTEEGTSGDTAEENSEESEGSEESSENSENSAEIREASGEEGGDTTPGRSPDDHQTATITTEQFVATVDNFGGGISSFRLIGNERYRVEAEEEGEREPLDLVTTWDENYQSMRIALGDEVELEGIAWDIEQVSPTEVRLSTEQNGLRIVRSLAAGDGPYQIWSTVRVSNVGRERRDVQLQLRTHHFVAKDDESGGSFLPIGSRSWYISHGVCLTGEDLERTDKDDLIDEGAQSFSEGVQMAAVENVYFVQAMSVSGERSAESCSMNAWATRTQDGQGEGASFEALLTYPQERLSAGESLTHRTLTYIGPKEPDALHAAAHGLPEVIDLGFFAIIARQLVRLLSFIHGLVGNWGLAIILMTLMIRLLLSPLTLRMYRSTARMRQLKPELDRINELYGEDREKKGAATMELYRKHKINPLGGCLPQMLQLPIWWALYTSLSTNIELFHMPFVGWLTDLSAPDEWKILPITLGLLMFLQQKLTPTTADPGQAKMMMYLMPGMFTAMMLFLPSGLCLYMLTNAALGIVQQKAVERFMVKAPTGDGEGSGDDDAEGSDEGGGSPGKKSSSTKGKRPKVRQRRRRGRA